MPLGGQARQEMDEYYKVFPKSRGCACPSPDLNSGRPCEILIQG